MRIAILGTRGIPARYGGFETFAQELSSRLAAKGHAVSVYCRSHLFPEDPRNFKGPVERILLPSVRSKHLETLSHTFFSALHLVRWKVLRSSSAPQVVVLCNGANAPLIPLIRLFGIKVLLNVDGIERKRRKWGRMGALWYRFGELCAVRFPDVVISDANVIADYYRSSHGAKSEVVTYGYDDSKDDLVANRLEGQSLNQIATTLKLFDLTERGYILYVSRLEPENNCHQLLMAYKKLQEEIKDLPELVIVGNAPYATEYISSLRASASKGVKFLGFQFGDTYRNLMLGARLYVQATEVGGTHPALVEAMGFGNTVIANKTPENAEVLGDAGLLYEMNSVLNLTDKLKVGLELTDANKGNSDIFRLALAARQRAIESYSWKTIVEKYEGLASQVTEK
jgi:glycosyltransferase involved in cell wall biosynthesis